MEIVGMVLLLAPMALFVGWRIWAGRRNRAQDGGPGDEAR
jgi:hypothetical protein